MPNMELEYRQVQADPAHTDASPSPNRAGPPDNCQSAKLQSASLSVLGHDDAELIDYSDVVQQPPPPAPFPAGLGHNDVEQPGLREHSLSLHSPDRPGVGSPRSLPSPFPKRLTPKFVLARRRWGPELLVEALAVLEHLY
ncbi:hypothetical protein C8Q74DRAFT_1367814 [Fomes fomentarius]|nr:hypothetical protein C8Q74DRAFT_1367814 [Fomes fomentarius]